MNGPFDFPGVTLLITHYNRSSSLERLLKSFSDLNCRFEEILVSDDASKPEQQAKLRLLQVTYNYRLITREKNGGLPANMNSAQAAIRTPYTLYVQEDFVPTAICPAHLQDALQIMKDRPDFDYIRFWSFYRYPTLKPYAKGFSETVFSAWNLSHLKFFMYSDNPHLRHSTFLQKFGPYREGQTADIAEYIMSISYMQKKGKGLFYDAYNTLFTHENPPDEPSTMHRSNWRQGRSPALLVLRWFYLRAKWLKSYRDLKFMRT